MRKLLLFLVLFGSGLALLYFISSRQRRDQAERIPPAGESSHEVEDLPFTRIPDQPQSDGAQPERQGGSTGIAGTLHGHFESTVFEQGARGHKLYDIAIDNVIPLGEDLYDLEGITAHTFDPDSEALESTLVAARGRARVEWLEGRSAVGRSDTIKLYEAVVKLYSGVPLAPLTLTLPSVQGDLENDVYTSEDDVLVEGAGIVASGHGLLADQRNELCA